MSSSVRVRPRPSASAEYIKPIKEHQEMIDWVSSGALDDLAPGV